MVIYFVKTKTPTIKLALSKNKIQLKSKVDTPFRFRYARHTHCRHPSQSAAHLPYQFLGRLNGIIRFECPFF